MLLKGSDALAHSSAFPAKAPIRKYSRPSRLWWERLHGSLPASMGRSLSLNGSTTLMNTCGPVSLIQADVTPEMLMQIFYPNTPLHDGAVIISGKKIIAAACVMPLSSSGILARSPERKMGLRHRAAVGISEVSDAIAVVVSEETGAISIAHAGRMIRRLDVERLENILSAFYNPEKSRKENFFQRHFPYLFPHKDE